MFLCSIIKKIIALTRSSTGSFSIMYALLLPLLVAFLSLSIDSSNLLAKQARLADIVTESLVSTGTHSYTSEYQSKKVLDASLAHSFPDDETLISAIKIEITQQNSGKTHYQQLAAAQIDTQVFLPLTKLGFSDKQKISYLSPEYSQTSSGKGILMNHQTTLDMTGIGMDHDGGIWMWGFRGTGQQGNGVTNVTDSQPPQKVMIPPNDPLNQVKNIKYAGGYANLITLDSNGDAWAWGQDLYGEAGSAVCKGQNRNPNPTPCKVLSNVADISSGEYVTTLLKKDGTLWFMGQCLYSQCGDPTNRRSRWVPEQINLDGERVTLIGSAYEGTFAITVDNKGKYSVWGFGDNEGCGLGFTQTNVSGQTDINGKFSQCRYPTQDYNGLSRSPRRITGLDKYADQIVYIGGGDGWGEALLEDGTVIGWGAHVHLGQGYTYPPAITTPYTNLEVEEPIVIMRNVRTLHARYVGSAAITNDNKLYTWGGLEIYQIYGRNVTHRADNVYSISTGKEFMFYTDLDFNSYGIGYHTRDKFLLGNRQNYLNHPLNGLNPGQPGNENAINWPGIEMNFAQFDIDIGNGKDPKPMPVLN